ATSATGPDNWWPAVWCTNWSWTGATVPPGLNNNWWITMSPATTATGNTWRGVGADPRGLRQFNLDKQAQQYDPEGHYVQRWQGTAGQPVGLHTVDAADWPIQGL